MAKWVKIIACDTCLAFTVILIIDLSHAVMVPPPPYSTEPQGQDIYSLPDVPQDLPPPYVADMQESACNHLASISQQRETHCR